MLRSIARRCFRFPVTYDKEQDAYRLSQQEEQCRIHNEEERNTRGEEAGDGVVDVEVIEFCRRDRVDCARCDGEDEDCAEENGIADEGIADRHHEGGQDEEAQGEEVECIRCVAARAVQVDECADGQHAEPRAEVDQPLECRTDCGRAFDARRIECETRCHAEDAELIPREEDIEEAHVNPAAAPVIFVLEVVILRHREDGEDKHQCLKDAHDLRVGKALLTVEDEGADAAERGDVGHHGVRKIRAAIEGTPIFADEECPADESRKEDDEDAVDRDECEIPRDRERPAAHEGEHGVDDDDVQAQDAADEGVGDLAVSVEEVADDERREEVCEEVDDAEIRTVHEKRFFLSK